MRLYVTNGGRWAGTQEDAKQLASTDGGWRQEIVPETKAELIAWLNEHEVMRDRPCAPPVFEVPTAENFDATDAVEGKYGPGDFIPGPGQVEEMISKAEGNVLGGYVLAAVCRVGEIKGVSLGAFRSWCKSPGRGAVDRGLLRIGTIALIEAAGE